MISNYTKFLDFKNAVLYSGLSKDSTRNDENSPLHQFKKLALAQELNLVYYSSKIGQFLKSIAVRQHNLS